MNKLILKFVWLFSTKGKLFNGVFVHYTFFHVYITITTTQLKQYDLRPLYLPWLIIRWFSLMLYKRKKSDIC